MENIKKIKVADMIKNYNSFATKEAQDNYIRSIIVRNYVPILEKKLVIQSMFDKSVINEDGNIYVDMFVNKINVTFGILTMYTRLQFVKADDTESLFDDYDLLVESNLLNEIFNCIEERELTQILTINDQVHETFYNKHKSTEAFVNSVVTRVKDMASIMSESLLSQLPSIFSQEDLAGLMEMINNSK